jgi:uncharacterized protein (DUF1499 family)
VDLYKVIVLIFILSSCTGTRPTNLGLKEVNGRQSLNSCPDKPNCVISDSSDKDHYLSPIKVTSNKERAHKKVTGILSKNSSFKIISSNPDYIYAEYTSMIFRFVDDVEFYFGEEGFVHFRSASRIGKSDLGANKKRIEDQRFKFQQNDF